MIRPPGAAIRTAAVAVAALLIFSIPARADIALDSAEVAAVVAASPGAAEFPAAGALIIHHGKSLIVRDDGVRELDEHLLVKILQDRGRDFGDQKRNFDSDTDSVEVLTARTWLADGRVVDVEQQAINVITPPELTGAAIYADIRQKVISFGQIAPGAVIELRTRTVSRPDSLAGEDEPWWDMEVFRASEPILRKRCELLIPAAAPAPKVVRRNGLDPAAVDSVAIDGRAYRRWTWEMRDIPMIQSIPDMPPTRDFAPWLLVSGVDHWQGLGRWLADRFYPSVDTTGAVRSLADSLLAGASTRGDSVRALTMYVTTEVRNIGLALPLTGYRPTPAARVLENMYGHSLDKAVLLVSLLNSAGIKAWPSLGASSMIELFEQDAPAAAQFDRVMVYVPDRVADSTFVNPLHPDSVRHGLWLHPTAQYNRYGYYGRGQGTRALIVLPSGGALHRMREFGPGKSLSLVRARMVLAPNGDVAGNFSIQTDGIFDIQARMTLKDATPRERRQYFSRAANAIAEGAAVTGAELSDLRDLTLPASLRFDFAAPELGVVQGEMMILHVPAPPFGFTGLPYFPDQDRREYDFVGDGPFSLVREYSIELPEGWDVAYMPAAEQRETAFGRWLVDCTREGNRLELRRSFSSTARSVAVEDYREFRVFFQQFTLPRQTLILLERR